MKLTAHLPNLNEKTFNINPQKLFGVLFWFWSFNKYLVLLVDVVRYKPCHAVVPPKFELYNSVVASVDWTMIGSWLGNDLQILVPCKISQVSSTKLKRFSSLWDQLLSNSVCPDGLKTLNTSPLSLLLKRVWLDHMPLTPPPLHLSMNLFIDIETLLRLRYGSCK